MRSGVLPAALPAAIAWAAFLLLTVNEFGWFLSTEPRASSRFRSSSTTRRSRSRSYQAASHRHSDGQRRPFSRSVGLYRLGGEGWRLSDARLVAPRPRGRLEASRRSSSKSFSLQAARRRPSRQVLLLRWNGVLPTGFTVDHYLEARGGVSGGAIFASLVSRGRSRVYGAHKRPLGRRWRCGTRRGVEPVDRAALLCSGGGSFSFGGPRPPGRVQPRPASNRTTGHGGVPISF